MILVAGAASVAPSSPAVMANMVTWTSQNGYSSIQWNGLTEITIFHVYPIANGSIVYDGSEVNLPSVIATAHSHNVKVCLAVGGSGSPAWNYDSKIVNSPSLRAALANNIAAEVSKEGYDWVHWDFENNLAGFQRKELHPADPAEQAGASKRHNNRLHLRALGDERQCNSDCTLFQQPDVHAQPPV